MIRIFEQGHEDFSSIGLGEIQPLSCVVREEQGGAYELEIEMAMDEQTRYDRLLNGRVLQVPVPAMTTPLIKTLDVTVTEFWRTNGSVKLYSKKTDVMGTNQTVTVPAQYAPDEVGTGFVLIRAAYSEKRWVPNGNRVLQTVRAFQKVTVLNKSDAVWWRVTTKEGKTGYLKKEKLTFFEQYNTKPGDTIQSRQIRDQLFRIYRTEKDTEALRVRAWARHIYYDLLGVVLKACKLPSLGVTAALYAIDEAAFPAGHGFEFLTNSVKILKKCDYTHRSMIDAHLNPDDGVLAKGNLRLVRDNYDVFFLKRSSVRSKTITYGKNLKGVTIDINSDGIVNRIIPVGKRADGSILYKNNTYPSVSSPRNTAATEIRCKAIEYDVEVGEEYTTSQAQQELLARAEAEFEKGIDLPSISVTVDFLQLGDTEEYAQYKDLDRLYLSDIVRIIDPVHGVDLEAEVTEYSFDCLTGRYISLGVGVTSAKRAIGSVGSFMLPNGAISGTKLALGSVNGSRIEDLSIKSAQVGMAAIQTAHIQDAAITRAKIDEALVTVLKADAIEAVSARIRELIAGSITTDQLYADIAQIAIAQLTTANILSADITWANIASLAANIAQISQAQMTTAVMNRASIDWAAITALSSAVASIASAQIATADIDWAHIKDLTAGTAIITQGVGGELFIARLAVTEANLVSLTTGELVLRGQDGAFYSISVDPDGQVVTTLKQVTNNDLSDVILDENDNIIYGGITASKLNVQDIFAENATIAALIAANIDVDTLWARTAFIEKLKVADLLTNDAIRLRFEGVEGDVSSLQTASRLTNSYITLGKLIDSDNQERMGIAIGENLLDENGEIVQAHTAVRIFSDRQTFYQNGVVGMELKNNSIQAVRGAFEEVTLNGQWKQTITESGTYAIMWVG